MQFFKNYISFNEGFNRNKSIEELQYAIAELKKDKPSVKTVLKHVNRVFRRSDVLDNKDIETVLAMIHDKLAEKIVDQGELIDMKKTEEYVKLDNYIKKLDERGAEAVKNTLAEYQKLKDAGEIVEEAPKKEEVAKEETAAKEIDVEKIKKMFDGTKITAKSAPQLSKTLVKTELAEVKALQQFLADKGFLATSEAVSADGYFGDKTANAVMAYQKSKGLKEDGIVGTNTWKAVLADVKMDTDKEFKAFQLNAPTQTAKVDKKEDEKEAIAGTAGTASKLAIQYDDALPQVTSLDEVVKLLKAQELNSATFDTNELKVAKLLIGQVLVKGITNQNAKDLLSKYQAAVNSDLIKDLLYAFDDETAVAVNSRYKSILQYKDKPEYIEQQKMMKIADGNSLADQKKNLSLIFLALAKTKSKEIIDALTANKVNVKSIETINA